MRAWESYGGAPPKTLRGARSCSSATTTFPPWVPRPQVDFCTQDLCRGAVDALLPRRGLRSPSCTDSSCTWYGRVVRSHETTPAVGGRPRHAGVVPLCSSPRELLATRVTWCVPPVPGPLHRDERAAARATPLGRREAAAHARGCSSRDESAESARADRWACRHGSAGMGCVQSRVPACGTSRARGVRSWWPSTRRARGRSKVARRTESFPVAVVSCV